MASGPERVQQALDALGISAQVVRLPGSTRTAAEAAQAVGCEESAIVKSLLFMADDEPVLVLCAGNHRVDTGAVAAMLGATQVKMAPVDDVRRITGFAIGGVPPLGHPAKIRTLMDESLLTLPVVYAAAGAQDALFPIEPVRLLEAAEAVTGKIGA